MPNEQLRFEIGQAISRLDEESFIYVAFMLWNLSKSAGGFEDSRGWAKLRKKLELVTSINDFIVETVNKEVDDAVNAVIKGVPK